MTREAHDFLMDQVQVVGHATLVSLRGQAAVDVEDLGSVEVRFEPVQERVITHALHEHERVMVRVKGRGTFDPGTGRVKAVHEVELIEPLEAAAAGYDASARPSWQIVADIASGVPAEEWNAVPDDLSERVDYYIHPGARDSQDYS